MEKPSRSDSGIYRVSPDHRGPHRQPLTGTCATPFIRSQTHYSDGRDGRDAAVPS